MKPVMYLGEGVDLFGAIRHIFKTKNNKRHFYNGSFRLIYFGGIYEMGNDSSIKKAPKEICLNWHPTEAEKIEYEARKHVVKSTRALRNKIMKIKKPHGDIVKIIKLLRPFYRSLPKWDQSKLMEYIANECSKKK